MCSGLGSRWSTSTATAGIDLIQANGHVLDRARLVLRFAMRPTLLRNAGGDSEDVTDHAGTGSSGRCWGAVWPSATLTVTADPTSS